MLLLVSSQSFRICVLSQFPTQFPVKLNDVKSIVTLENKMALFKRVELGQETLQSKNEVLPLSVKYEIP